VDLINVSATVTDASGRFVPGLHQDDFIVYEDGTAAVTHFSAALPVSLGIVLDEHEHGRREMGPRDQALDRFLLDCSATGRGIPLSPATTRCSCRTGRRIECLVRSSNASSRAVGLRWPTRSPGCRSPTRATIARRPSS
jgi:hypothetical protein